MKANATSCIDGISCVQLRVEVTQGREVPFYEDRRGCSESEAAVGDYLHSVTEKAVECLR